MSKKDPTDGIEGYQWWQCSNCAASGSSTVLKVRLVKWFMNPAQAMPSQPKNATVYCPDCPKGKQLYCTACAGRGHAIGTKTQHHSLEAINPAKTSWIYFLPPWFDFLFLPTVLFFMVWEFGGKIPTDYMSGRDLCPLIHTARRKMYHFDAGLTYLLKDTFFARACNLEDGYFRLIIDAWVRAISTDTDSMLLLTSACIRAYIFHKFAIRLFVLPFLVLMHMTANAGVYLALAAGERLGGVPAMPPQIKKAVHKLSLLLQLVIKATYDPSDLPPPTDPRLRPRCDHNDARKYWVGRRTRIFKFFYAAAQSRVATLTVGLPVLAAAVRAMCITTSFDWYLRRLCSLPGDVTNAHSDVPLDALGHTLDQVVFAMRPLSLRIFRVAVPHVPYALLICGGLLYSLYYYPYLRNWIDTRNWYGGHCGKAPKTDFTSTCRWFPHTWETEDAILRRASTASAGGIGVPS